MSDLHRPQPCGGRTEDDHRGASHDKHKRPRHSTVENQRHGGVTPETDRVSGKQGVYHAGSPHEPGRALRAAARRV